MTGKMTDSSNVNQRLVWCVIVMINKYVFIILNTSSFDVFIVILFKKNKSLMIRSYGFLTIVNLKYSLNHDNLFSKSSQGFCKHVISIYSP